MKNRIWIIIFSLLLISCAVWWIFISSAPSQSKTVGIYQNGSLIEKIDLNSVTAEREIALTGEYGTNTIYISQDHIEMKSAECPDKLCVKHGELKESGAPIVCLPNRVVIKFENGADDADARTGAAG